MILPCFPPRITRGRVPLVVRIPHFETDGVRATQVKQFEVVWHGGMASESGRGASLTPHLQVTMPSRSLWRNRSARSAVNRKDGGSSPPRDVVHGSHHLHSFM